MEDPTHVIYNEIRLKGNSKNDGLYPGWPIEWELGSTGQLFKVG